MQIDAQMVAQVAKLAHLKLSDEEVVYYQNHLESILGYVMQLDKLAQSLPATASEPVIQSEREDVKLPSVGAEQAVVQAPESSGTFFQVPRIIE
jgi:aspartyl-tRNA(Asn)/glutamyl-tRNA(Gln) amidotransferase subunit C